MASPHRHPLSGNMIRQRHGGWVIVVSFLIAFLLTELPIPAWAAIWRPAWVGMVVIYWCMALPERVSVGTAWLVGLVLDTLGGGLLGQHALGLCSMAYAVNRFHTQPLKRQPLPIWQQTIGVFALMSVYQLLILWINGMQGRPIPEWAYVSLALTTTLLWPWASIILRDVQRKFRVV